MTSHQSKPKTRRIFIPFVLVAVVVLAWSGFWLFGANLMKSKASERIAWLEGQGYQVNFESLEVSGWPYRFVLMARDVQVVTPPKRGSVQLSTTTLLVHAMAWKMSHLIVEVPDPVQAQFQNGDQIIYVADLTRASMVFIEQQLSRVSLEMQSPKLQNNTSSYFISAKRIEAHLRPGTSAESRAIYAYASAPVWPNMPMAPVDEFRMQGEVFAWSELLTGRGLLAFRAPEGQLVIERASVVSGSASIDVSGSVQIDVNGYLSGPVKIGFIKPGEFMAAINSDIISQEAQNTITALSLLIGGVSETELSFKLRKGGIYVGPFRIGSTAPVL